MVFFRAGAAPWHDDMACFRSVSRRLKHAPFHLFESLDIWDICALIAQSRVYCGSSLHGRILAMSFALPRLNFLHPAQTGATKQAAYARTWDMAQALGASTEAMAKSAAQLGALYLQEFEAWRRLLKVE